MIKKKQFLFFITITGGLLLAAFLAAIIFRRPFVSGTIVDIVFAISLPLIFIAYLKVSKTMERKGILYLSTLVLILAAAALYYSQTFRIVTIKVVGNSYGGLKYELEEFNKKQKEEGNRIRAELVDDWSSYYNTNKKWEEAKRYLKDKNLGIDVIELDVAWTKPAVSLDRDKDKDKKGVLHCLDNYWKNLKERSFNANAIEGGKHDGKLYAIPFYLDVGLFFYRKDILGNLDQPISLEDLKQSLDKLKNKNKEGLIFQGGPYEGLICTFLDLHNLLNINHGELKTEENGDVRLDTDEILKTIKFIHFWMHKGEIKIIPLSVFGYDEYNSRDSFVDGHAVVLRSWPFVIQNSNKSIGVLKFKNSKPVLRGWYLAILENSDHKEEAWELIKHLTSNDEQRRRAAEYKEKRFPPEQSVIDDLEGSYPWLNEVSKAIQNSSRSPSLPNYMDFSREFSKALFRIFSKPEISDEEIKRQLSKCEDKINKTNPQRNL